MSTLTEGEVAELERLEKAATKAPWAWHAGHEGVSLRTPHSGQLVVLDVSMKGHLRFAKRSEIDRGGIMHDAGSLVEGARPLRTGFTTLNNPDATLIPSLRNSAPQLLSAWRESQAKSAEIARLRGALEKIADAPACGPDGQLYYEVASEDGQVGCMHVDPLGWIGSAATTARAALAKEGE